MTEAEAQDFIRANTALTRAPHVPEFALHLATEITPIWQATEHSLNTANLAPPFWAFAWPGSQALARYMLDNSAQIAGRRVLDFAAGCGLAALAAIKAGAAWVEAAEIDPLAIAAIKLNAAENRLVVETLAQDVVGQNGAWDIILCGDICYEAPMTRHVLPWLAGMAALGKQVWIADPGRAYLPRAGLRQIAEYQIATSLELEDRLVRCTRVFNLTREIA
jgi:predicted nicotinamide N-methyase